MQLLWVPMVVAAMFATMWLSYRSNQSTQAVSSYFFLNWLLACVPTWALISLFSKDLVFDALLYDIVVCVSCALFAVYFANQHHFVMTTMQVVGVVLMLVGIVVFRMG